MLEWNRVKRQTRCAPFPCGEVLGVGGSQKWGRQRRFYEARPGRGVITDTLEQHATDVSSRIRTAVRQTERGKRLHQTGNCASFGFAAQAVIPRCGIFDGRLRHVCNCAAPKLHGLTDSFKRPDDRILDLRAKGYQSRNDRSRQKDDDNAPVPASEGC
jgi:hypothetical protein